MVPRVDTRQDCAEKPFGHKCECRRCGHGEHCGNHDTGCHQGCRGTASTFHARRRLFEVYRPREHTRPGLGNTPPGHPRFTGAVFPSGKVVIEWGPPIRSIAVYPSLTACLRVHAHGPDFGSFVRWLTPGPAVLPAALGIPEVLPGPGEDEQVAQLLGGGREAIRAWRAREEAAATEPAEALRAVLRGLHLKAGRPSTRRMAAGIRDLQGFTISHSTVSLALRPQGAAPSWRVTAAVTRELGGDVKEISKLWVEAAS